ncbi:Kelch repeat-containing protein [Aureivirga sp. CE67]|uniref:Kelch repeat-containing protein n=1 Tax=Aureivirga sp. CE67 TaxID=1788983 RepID=UPI0018CA3EF7|nr:kelch repeat-containing protein [Aureivirga sp. CE67]
MNLIYKIGMLLLVISFVGCSDEDDTEIGNWVERSVFDGIPRSSAASFTIGNKGYIGTGYDGDDYLSDFWEYNSDGDYWAQKADFPGVPRSSAVGLAINDKGYIGTGYDDSVELSDFWEYNPGSNSWEQKADFGGGQRRSAVAFDGAGKGFLGTGYDGTNDKKDFWKYDPNSDTWTEIVGFGGEKRRSAATFEIDGNIYLGTGVSNGIYKTDFWMFDPNSETWTKKKDIDEDIDDGYTILRANSVGLSVGGYGFFTTGYNGGALYSTWQYDPLDDSWEETTAIEGVSRQDASGFNINGRAYVLLGRTGSLYFDDNFELFPFEEFDDED